VPARLVAPPRAGGDWSVVGWAVLTLGGLALMVAGLMSPWQAVDRGGPAVILALRFPQPLLLAVLGSLSLAALLLLALLVPRQGRRKRKDDEEFQLYHEPPKLSVWALLVLLGLALVPVGILVSLFWLPGTPVQDAAPPPIVRGPAWSAPPPGSPSPSGPGRPAVSLPLYTGVIGLLALLVALGSLALLLWIFLGDRLARWWGGPLVEPTAVEPLVEAVEASLDDLRRESDARRAIILCYRRLEQWLAGSGAPRAPWDTPAEFMQRALRRLPIPSEAASTVTRLFEVARFSEHALGSRERDVTIGALVAIKGALEQAQRTHASPV
jgi:hypothetical protein